MAGSGAAGHSPSDDSDNQSSSGDLEPLARFLRVSVFPAAEQLRILALERPAGGASWETFFARLSVQRDGIADNGKSRHPPSAGLGSDGPL